MITYIIRRLLLLPLIMVLVTLILFFLIMQLPVEQRVSVYLPSSSAAATLDPEESARLVQNTIEKYGLDEPFIIQYANWLRNLVSGEWGYSPTWRQPVFEGLMQRVPATAELAITAMVPAVILALVLGSLAARYRNRWPDHVIQSAAFVAWAFPAFILGLMLMNVFYAWLGWFPPERLSIGVSISLTPETFRSYTGMYTVDALLNRNWTVLRDAARHLVLPALTLALAQWALLSRVMRSAMVDVLAEDYITTARAKGLPERRIFGLHARRNAILPVISTGGVAVSLLLTGVVVIETVFNFNGIGRAAAESIVYTDIPVAVGFAVFSCTVTVMASLAVDVLYVVFDPRIRY